jgi:hypothetical protein
MNVTTNPAAPPAAESAPSSVELTMASSTMTLPSPSPTHVTRQQAAGRQPPRRERSTDRYPSRLQQAAVADHLGIDELAFADLDSGVLTDEPVELRGRDEQGVFAGDLGRRQAPLCDRTTGRNGLRRDQHGDPLVGAHGQQAGGRSAADDQ